MRHLLLAMTGRDDPPDFPGAVGASDLELLALSRRPAERTIDDARGDAVRLFILGASSPR